MQAWCVCQLAAKAPSLPVLGGWMAGARATILLWCAARGDSTSNNGSRDANRDGGHSPSASTSSHSRSRPVSLSMVAVAGASQDPTILCAVRAPSTPNNGSRDANRGWRTKSWCVHQPAPKALSLSAPGCWIAGTDANQCHSILCSVRAKSTSRNGIWSAIREGGWTSRWWTKSRCFREPARSRGGCWV